MSLYKTIQQIVQSQTELSTAEIFQRVRPQFPNDNPSYLKCRIAQVRCVTRKKLEEKTFLSGRVGV